jgi:transcriptional regulator with XRE-family HTH domain
MARKRQTMMNQLRKLIETSGLTRYQIAKATGIDQATMTRFANGERTLSAKAVNALGDFLDLEIKMHGPRADRIPKDERKSERR